MILLFLICKGEKLMKYKNIVFDFGNVIGRFDGRYILEHFCSSEEDYRILSGAIFPRWPDLDKGTIDYDSNIETVAFEVPDRLKENVRTFFKDWPKYVDLLPQTTAFIKELRETDANIYLLSNASTYFAEWFSDREPIKDFDGIVFSAPLKMAKPEPKIYNYLFRQFHLDPEDCFFIDDLAANILTGKSLGMDGIVFTGDIEEVKKKIDF